MKANPAFSAIACLFILFAHTLQAQDPFITTWQVLFQVSSGTAPLTIPTSGGGYSYTVNWGDGTTDNTVYTGDATHEYADQGYYPVAISGSFPTVYFKNTFVNSVNQWGDIQFQSLEQAFAQCYGFIGVGAPDAPDLSAVTSLAQMFESTSSMGASDLSGWDVSTITNMQSMFLQSGFHGDVSTWDVSSVLDMTYMFYDTPFNGDVSNWNTGNVTSMAFMFRDCNDFNSDIGNWDISSITEIGSMLEGASSFDQDLGSWDISDGPVSLNGTHLSPQNYSNTLIGWATLDAGESVIPTFMNLQAGGLTYCDDTGRAALIATYNWSISDGGPAHPVPDLAQLPAVISETPVESITAPTSSDCTTPIVGQTDAVFPITTSQFITWTYTNLGALETQQQQFVYVGKPFITTWQTTTENESITIPTSGGGYYYLVDWGDGTTYGDTYTGNATHAYDIPGTYTVSIAGNFPHLFFNNGGDKNKIRTIEQWGDIAWGTMFNSFYGCGNLSILATDVPDLSAVNTLENTFFASGVSGDLSSWDVSNVTNMVGTFYGSTFNGDISSWNTSNVTNMNAMFGESQFNGNINDWDVSNVTDMDVMFYNSDFNQSLNNWNVSAVTTMVSMFGWSAFNGDVSGWDVSGVTHMQQMFEHSPFAGDISAWNVSNVTNMYAMLTYVPFVADLSGWDVSSVTNMSYMFYWSQVNQSLAAWDIGSVTNMESMFANAYKMTQENYESTLAGWASLDAGETLVPLTITLGADGLRYCSQAARNTLINDYTWTFVGDINDCKPELSSIGNKTVDEDVELAFTALATDPELGTLGYSLDQASLDKGMVIYATGQFTWTPTNDHVGVNEVTITVTDGALTDSETITITVAGINDAPIITAVADYALNQDETVAFNIVFEDPDSEILEVTLDAASIEKGMTLSSAGAFSWTPSAAWASDNEVTVTVSDGELTASETFIVYVNVGVMLASIPNKLANALEQLAFYTLAEDGNYDDIVYDLDVTSINKGMSVTSGIFTWTPTIDQGGEHEVTMSVTDGVFTDYQTFFINVNLAPILAAIGNKVTDEDQTLTFTLSAEDESVVDLVFSLDVASADKGMSINSEGVFSWTPTSEFGGTYVTITVTDNRGLTDSELFLITINSVNDAPIFAPIPDKQVNEDETLSFQVPATDEDYAGFGFSLDATSTSKGIGLLGYNEYGEITWTPGNSFVGVHEVTITVTDGFNTVSETFTITVINVDDAPVMNDVPNKFIDEEQTLTFAFFTTDVDSETLTYELDASSVAKGMTVSSGGEFNWATTEADVGDHSVTITVSDAELTDSKTFTISVFNLNVAPELAALGEYSIAVGETLTLTATATDADNDVLTFTVDESSTNQGMSITTAGVFTWTPTEGQVGLHGATIIVRDGTTFDFQSFQISVSPANSPKLNAIGDKEVNEDQLLSFTVLATDPDSPVLTFGLDAASIVKGMTITPTGQFSWTPDFDKVGANLVTFTVQDGEFVDLEDITITVHEMNDMPQIVKNQGLAVMRGEDGTITNDILLVTDEETPAENVVYTVASIPVNGAMFNNAVAIAVNSTFSQADINANAITYEHNGEIGATDSFSFTVSDGDGGEIASTVFSISIQIVTAVETGSDAGVVVYPLPAQDVLNIRMVNEYRGQVNFKLINAAGQYIVRDGVTKGSAELNHTLNIGQASSGIHFLQIITGGELRTLTVIKK